MSIRLVLCALFVFMFAAMPYAFSQAQTAAPASATPVAAASDDGVIGNILEVEGTATIATQGGAPVAATVNAPVHLNDVVATGAQSRVFILLIDNTQWTLSENSRLTVDEWVFDPDNNANNKGRYSVMQGAFQYISGLLAKKADPDVQIETPAGSIGIRGTDITGGDVDGSYGIQVDDGAIDVKTDAGQVRVNKGEGTTLRGRKFAPDRPAKWNPERLARVRQQVYLQHRDRVQQRMAQMQPRHQEMRQRYKQFMATHPRGQMQQQQQQRREMLQQRRGQMQQQGGKQEQRQQAIEQWREKRQQQGQAGQALGWRPREQQQQQANNPVAGFRRLQQQQGQQPAAQQAQGQGQAATAVAPGTPEARKAKLEELRANRRKRWEELKDQKDQQQDPSQTPPAQ